MRPILIAMAALMLALPAGAPAAERTRNLTHATHLRIPRPHKPHTSRSTYRTVRVHKADGTVLAGYRDSLGTHLTGPDGRTIHCQRQISAADIDVACR